jgi:ankyrin repeat protein
VNPFESPDGNIAQTHTMAEESELFLALRAGDDDAIRRAIEAEPGRALCRDADGNSLLMSALVHRRTELVAFLLERLGSLDCFEAAALGRLNDLATAASRSHSVITNQAPDGTTVLHIAAHFGHADLVSWLIRHGAPVDSVARNPSLSRPIHHAVAAGSARVAIALLQAGADPNGPQRGGYTPLHLAAHRGDADLVDLLVAHGADVNLPSDDRQLPADLARARGHLAIAARLTR